MDSEAVKKLPTVPESILKKRKRRSQLKAKELKTRLINKKNHKTRVYKAFKRAEAYVKEYRNKFKNEVRLRREAKKSKKFYVSDAPKLLFVIRIKGINGVPPKVKKVLRLFRLRQINNAVFIKINTATLNMLKLVEPYVSYGYPNLKTIRDLLYKRGFAKISKQRIPITNNGMIEKNLGKYNLICMEDLIHEIYTVGSNFKKTSNFLWPFKLNNPTGGWKRKNKHYVEGGDFGNREHFINHLVQKMV